MELEEALGVSIFEDQFDADFDVSETLGVGMLEDQPPEPVLDMVLPPGPVKLEVPTSPDSKSSPVEAFSAFCGWSMGGGWYPDFAGCKVWALFIRDGLGLSVDVANEGFVGVAERGCVDVFGYEELLAKVEDRSDRFIPVRKLEFCQENKGTQDFICIPTCMYQYKYTYYHHNLPQRGKM